MAAMSTIQTRVPAYARVSFDAVADAAAVVVAGNARFTVLTLSLIHI